MHGSVFKMFFLLCILGIGGAFLFWTGLLPSNFYPPIYQFTDNLSINTHASEPYLQKYEGHWALTFSPTQATSAFLTCPAFSVIVTSHDGQFLGHATVPGYLIGLEASTTVSGILTGVFYSGNRQYSGVIRGTVGAGEGSGPWQDNEDCSGTWTLSKSSPVVDPSQGRIVSLNGRVYFERPTLTDEAWPEESLYVGDILKVPSGGQAILELGPDKHTVTVPANETYVVPDAGGNGQ